MQLWCPGIFHPCPHHSADPVPSSVRWHGIRWHSLGHPVVVPSNTLTCLTSIFKTSRGSVPMPCSDQDALCVSADKQARVPAQHLRVCGHRRRVSCQQCKVENRRLHHMRVQGEHGAHVALHIHLGRDGVAQGSGSTRSPPVPPRRTTEKTLVRPDQTLQRVSTQEGAVCPAVLQLCLLLAGWEVPIRSLCRHSSSGQAPQGALVPGVGGGHSSSWA